MLSLMETSPTAGARSAAPTSGAGQVAPGSGRGAPGSGRRTTPPLVWLARAVLWLSFAAVTFALATGRVTVGEGAAPPAWRLWLAAGVVAAVAIALGARAVGGRRAWPGAGLVALALLCAIGPVLAPVTELTLLPYVAVAVVARDREPGPAWALLAPPAAAEAYVSYVTSGNALTAAANVVIAAGIAGTIEWRRRRREAEELDAAQQVALLRERARAEEARSRAELAGHVHDVLAHSLSGLVVSLQVAELQAVAEGASPELRDRLSAAGALAREGLRGARDAVETLRGTTPLGGGDATADAAADPAADAAGDGVAGAEGDGAAWLTAMVGRLSAATGVVVTVAGTPEALAGQRRRTAEAVVREALTNSVRHAPGLPVEIRVSSGEVDVLTRGNVAAAPVTDHVSGQHGLDRLRRRVEAAGGSLRAGPVPEGWRVTARWGT